MRSDYFRDQLIAASLKRRDRAEHTRADIAFPRSIDRGLIEAMRASVVLKSHLRHFRDQLIAASLKQASTAPSLPERSVISAIN